MVYFDEEKFVRLMWSNLSICLPVWLAVLCLVQEILALYCPHFLQRFFEEGKKYLLKKNGVRKALRDHW